MLFNQGRVSEIIAVTLTDGHFIGRSGDSSGEFGEVNSSGDFIHTVVECVFVDADHKTECFLCFSNLLFRDLCIITVITLLEHSSQRHGIPHNQLNTYREFNSMQGDRFVRDYDMIQHVIIIADISNLRRTYS